MNITRSTVTRAAVFTLLTLCMGFYSCVDQSALPLGTEANLLQLSVGNVTVAKIPAPISTTAWESESGLGLYSEDFSSAQFNKESDITDARIKPKLSRDATAEWGIGNRTVRPGEFKDTRVPATFESDEFIYIKVTSGDKATVRYYRFYTKVFSWVTDLASIKIKEREAKSAIGSETLDNLYGIPDTNDMMGSISITTSEATDAVIIPTTFDPNATVRFARAAGSAVPEFQAAATPITFEDQDYLYVEVTAENTEDKTFFKFRVNVGRMNTIASLKFNDGSADDIELFGTGLPNGTWLSVGPGEYATARANQPAAGYDVKIELDDPDGTFVYQKFSDASLPATNSAISNATFIDPKTNPTKFRFDDKDWLVIRVTSKNNSVRNYYKIQVTLLAAGVKAHPKSAWYYRPDVAGAGVSADGKKPVAPLTIELEGDTTGFTYQWYEADSLFGIYGRHGMSMDEKNNISTINGGPDMYYYLSKPGIQQYGDPINPAGDKDNPEYLEELAWEIPGANTNSYTPRIDWVNVPIRTPLDATQNSSYPVKPSSPLYNADYPAPSGSPAMYDPADKYHLGPNLKDGKPYPAYADNNVNFFAGSTCEVRYYWVVVKDPATGLTVTSDRAVILTETDPNTENFIFELSTLPRKNIIPFKVLRELYKINLPEDYFPAGFNPGKYEICVAQAQYYLPDGRPWTQNWTHGDLHFGYAEGSDKGSLTWWHNNLGANSGAIPLQTPHSAQGGLTQPPDWVGFAPSGDKGRGLPPLDARTGQLPKGYKPAGYPEGQAQGYFCGFIELMELRFATAPK